MLEELKVFFRNLFPYFNVIINYIVSMWCASMQDENSKREYL